MVWLFNCFSVDSNLCATVLWGHLELGALQVSGRGDGGSEGGESSNKAICSRVITALGFTWLRKDQRPPDQPIAWLQRWVLARSAALWLTWFWAMSELWALREISGGDILLKTRDNALINWFMGCFPHQFKWQIAYMSLFSTQQPLSHLLVFSIKAVTWRHGWPARNVCNAT